MRNRTPHTQTTPLPTWWETFSLSAFFLSLLASLLFVSYLVSSFVIATLIFPLLLVAIPVANLTRIFGWMLPIPSIRKGIALVESLQPISALLRWLERKEMQWCSFFLKVFSPHWSKKFVTLGDGYEKIMDALNRHTLVKFLLVSFAWLCPESIGTPLTELINGEISLANSLKVDIKHQITELDPSFDPLLNGATLVLFAILAYESEKNLRVRLAKDGWQVTAIEDKSQDSQAFIFRRGKTIIIAFRGTEGFNTRDWNTDFEFVIAPLQEQPNNLRALNGREASGVKVHSGFKKALLNSVNAGIYKHLRDLKDLDDDTQVYVVGHSLGGALSSVFVGNMLVNENSDTAWLKQHFGGLYTYGQPRCGNEEFAKLFTELEKENKVFRFVNCFDIIPRLPLLNEVDTNKNYVHHGTLMWIDLDGKINRIPRSQQREKEKVNLLLGTWGAVEKFFRKEQSLFRRIVRLGLPYFLNDHLPSDYLEALQKNADRPDLQPQKVLPNIKKLLERSKTSPVSESVNICEFVTVMNPARKLEELESPAAGPLPS